jgi:hypothetical protein
MTPSAFSLSDNAFRLQTFPARLPRGDLSTVLSIGVPQYETKLEAAAKAEALRGLREVVFTPLSNPQQNHRMSHRKPQSSSTDNRT